jgi:predicted small metal-binding protein
MAKVLHCRDVGFDCEGVISGDTEDDVMTQAAEHARTAHGMDDITPDTAEQIRSKIRDE